MISYQCIKLNLVQIFSITEKNLKITLRYKTNLVMKFLNPLISIILPLIIMNKFFSLQDSYGPWNARNYIVYILVGYMVMLNQQIISIIPGDFAIEKFWGTLQALMIAPFRRVNLLFGIILSHLILILIPYIIFIVICFIFFPITFITFLFIIFLTLAIVLIFASIGLILGVFQISREGGAKWIGILITFAFYLSCVSYPFEIFPENIQFFISLNPIYYLIDIIRLSWIEDNILVTITSHLIHVLVLIILVSILPIIGLTMFNYIFKKYGIVGY